jgi:hypothetical protein
MFYEPGSSEVSSTKFWHVIACFVATIAFIFINFAAPGSAGLEFIWATYLGVIAGSASLAKLISAKYGVVEPSNSTTSSTTTTSVSTS